MKHVVKRPAASNLLLVQKADELVTVEANEIEVFTCCSCGKISRPCAYSARLQSITSQPVIGEENRSVFSFQ